MWDVYDTKAGAQAGADKMTANMKLPLEPFDVTKRWDAPVATADGKWAIVTPTDAAILKDAPRGTPTVKPSWPEAPLKTAQAGSK